MKRQFCIIGATRGTGLLITQQLLEGGSSVRVVARDPDKASRLLGDRADVRQGDVTDAWSIRDALTEDYTAIFFTVAATGGIGGADIQIARAINKLTAGSKISRGDLARVMILASQQTVASRKTFDLFAAKGVAPSDEQLLKQLEEVPVDTELR